MTAFEDRDTAAFRKAVADLAWGSFAWCLSEPEHLIAFDGAVSGNIRMLGDFGKASEK